MMGRVTAFVFPGQGSQRIGMIGRLGDHDGVGPLVARAEELSGLRLSDIAADGPADALADTRVAQPLLFIADLAWGRALGARAESPTAVAGHSLGEFAALAFAGVLDDEEALALVCERSRLMAAVAADAGGTMAAVLGMDPGAIRDVVDGLDGVWVANENGPGQVVISGTYAGVERACEGLTAAGARRVVPLDVAGPFHSPLMAPAAEAFAAVLARTPFSDAQIPISQNTGASLCTRSDEIRERLVAQIVSPVAWTATLDTLRAAGVELLVECGPGSVLTGITRRYEGLDGVSVESEGIDRTLEVIG